MKVSLILTTYNCRDNLRKTLKSIEQQDYPDIEIVIKDGVSTDGTLELIQQYAGSHKNVIWKSETDTGIYDAMNQGYVLSTGDIIAFFNDTFNVPDAVSKLVDAIEKGGSECMGAHADLVYVDGEKVIRYWKMGEGKIKQGWMPGHPSLYLRRQIYEKYGLYDTSYRCAADFEFMVRVLKDNDVTLAYVPEVLIRMFYGGTSTGSLKSYYISIRESYHALKKNKISFPGIVIAKRFVRVSLQFARAK